ncbi:MAG: hypothetical protein ACKV2Q_21090 [Planctomycetaceae bacterium]
MTDRELDSALGSSAMNSQTETPPVKVVDEAELLLSVKQELEAVRQSSQAAFDRVSAELQRWQRPRPESTFASPDVSQNVADSLARLLRKQESLEALLLRETLPDSLPADSARPSLNGDSGTDRASHADAETSSQAPAWAAQWQTAINEQIAGWESRLQTLVEELKQRLPPPSPARVPAIVVEPEPVEPPPLNPVIEPNDARSQTWLRVLLGNVLFGNSVLQDSIQWLEQQALSGNGDALLLLGQLLVFRFSSADRKPALLKDVGEAFYRCFPKSLDASDPFEESLAAWLATECEAAGLPNRIELVHLGERFDASKHAPIERGGIEVTRVLGWVVLRDGGRVFSKASIQAR